MNPPTPPALKLCRRCNEQKPLSEFYRKVDKKKGWEGYNHLCKPCSYDYQRERDPHYNLRAALQLRKRDAVKHGVPFSITIEDLIPIPDSCPVLGIKLGVGAPGGSDHSVSIDRLKPELGYVKGNVVLMSLRANRIKNDSTPDELRKVADFLETKLNELQRTNQEPCDD